MVYKALNSSFLTYVADDCQLVTMTICKHLRSSNAVRFQELAQVWAIDLSLLLDRDSETTDLSTYMILNLPHWNSAGC